MSVGVSFECLFAIASSLPLATYSHTPGGAHLALPHVLCGEFYYTTVIHHTSDGNEQRLMLPQAAKRARAQAQARQRLWQSLLAHGGPLAGEASRATTFRLFSGSLLARMAVKRDASQHPADVRACIQHLVPAAVRVSQLRKEMLVVRPFGLSLGVPNTI